MQRAEAAVVALLTLGGAGFVLAASGGYAIEMFVSICLFGALAAILYRVWARETDARRVVLSIVLIAVAVRLVAVFVLPAVSQARFGIPFMTPSDPTAFDTAAMALVETPPSEWTIRRSHGFEVFLAALYRTFGRSLLLPRLFNVALAALLVVYAFDLADRLYDESVAKLTGLGVALLPSLVFISVRIGDDSIAILLTIVGVYYLIVGRSRLVEGKLPLIPAFVFMGSIVVLWYARHQIALLLVAVLMAWVGFLISQWAYRSHYQVELAFGVFGISAIGITLLIAQPDLLEELKAFLDQWSQINQTEGDLGLAKTIRGLPTIPRGILGLGTLFLMPFPPWEVLASNRLAPANFFATTSLLLALLAPFLIIGLKRSLLRNRDLSDHVVLILAFGLLTAGIAVIYGGTVPRFRTQIEVFLIIFASSGIAARVDRITYLLPYALYALFVGIYYFFYSG